MTAHALPNAATVKPADKKHQARAYYPHAMAARLIIAAIAALAVACLAAFCFAGPSDPRRVNGPADPAAPPAWTITDRKLADHPADHQAPAVCENGNCATAAPRAGRQPVRNLARRGGRFLGRIRNLGRGCN